MQPMAPLKLVGAKGTGTGNQNHAMLWSGTADSAIDLNSLLPPGFTMSEATSIDAAGDIFGEAFNSAGVHAVEWVQVVPEPMAAAYFLLILPMGLRRYRWTRH